MTQKKSFKYFTGYSYNDVIRPLCIKVPQMNGFVKRFHIAKTMIKNCSKSTQKYGEKIVA